MKFFCPCCGYKTLNEEPPGTYNICSICFWEDDPYQFKEWNYSEGANKVSLIQGQKNFEAFGACDRDMVKNTRKPNKNDERKENWKKF